MLWNGWMTVDGLVGRADMMDDGKEGCLERRVSGVIVLTVLCRV